MATQNLLKLLSVVEVDDEKRVDNSLVQFGRLTLVIKLSFCSSFEDKVSRFVQDFEVDVRARF